MYTIIQRVEFMLVTLENCTVLKDCLNCYTTNVYDCCVVCDNQTINVFFSYADIHFPNYG